MKKSTEQVEQQVEQQVEPAEAEKSIRDLAKLLEKLQVTANEIGILIKDETNKFGNYQYVPIDSYYQNVAHTALKYGLTWRIQEESCKQAGEETDKHGNLIPVFAFEYLFDLIDLETGYYWPYYSKLTVLHPMRGPQTSGSAMSYAEKLFMRTTFKVATKEEDADNQKEMETFRGRAVDGISWSDQARAQAVKRDKEEYARRSSGSVEPLTMAPRGQTVKASSVADSEWSSIAKVFEMALQGCRTQADLNEVWRENKHISDELKTESKERYDALVKMFSERKRTLQPAEEDDGSR